MDLKEQVIQEYLRQGCGYRKLQDKYGISRTTICKWVQIYQGITGEDFGHVSMYSTRSTGDTSKKVD